MIVEHTLRRQGVHLFPGEAVPRAYIGSEHILGETRYMFKPRPELAKQAGGEDADETAHICEVKKKEHIARFLSIPGFREFGKEEPSREAPPPPPAQGQPEVVTEILDDDEDKVVAKVPEKTADDAGEDFVAATLKLGPVKFKEALEGLSAEQLQALADAELTGKSRAKYLDAITDAQDELDSK